MKQIKTYLVVFILSLVSAGMFADDAIGALLSTAIKPLEPSEGQLVISIGNFTYADKGLASSFSGYLQEKLSSVVAHGLKFELFAREKLDEIMETHKLHLSGLFEEKGLPDVGELKGIQAILSGTFFDGAEFVTVFVELVSIESGLTSGKIEVQLPKAELPSGIAVLPGNYSDAIKLLEELKQVGSSSGGQFEVRAWTSRGDGGIYKDGEDMVIHFFANSDCYIKLYHIDVGGNATLIFPNQFHQKNFIEAEKIYEIPDDSYGFAFRLTAPFGAEFIKAVAQTVQFDDLEDSFTALGQASKGLVTRGMVVEQKGVRQAEALISYTIIEIR
jgi:hypothetical protein